MQPPRSEKCRGQVWWVKCLVFPEYIRVVLKTYHPPQYKTAKTARGRKIKLQGWWEVSRSMRDHRGNRTPFNGIQDGSDTVFWRKVEP